MLPERLRTAIDRIRRTPLYDLARSIRWGGPRAHRAPAKWVRAPRIPDGSRVCIFVLLVRSGRLMPHSVDHARAWHDAGFKVVIVVIVDSLTSPIDTAQLDFANAVLLRVNSGYDFGAWSATIRLLGRSVRRYALLVTANDSVLGPSNRFAAMLERVDRMDADVVGLVESVEVARHFQSFVLFFKPLALRSRVFRQFWGSIRTGNRDYVIDNYELKLRDRFIQAGLRVEAVHPVGSGPANNPTLHAWRELLSDGFPYIKIQLLRANPHNASLKGWLSTAEQQGFDPARLQRQLTELQLQDQQPWASNDKPLDP
jgi:hypothetical protein